MSSDSPARQRLLALAARRLKDGTSPYWVMTAFLFLSGVVGFLTSVGLLHAGVDRMPVRYPLAVAAGYLAFLSLLWLWLRNQRGDGGDEMSDVINAAYLVDSVPSTLSGSGAATTSGAGDPGLGSIPGLGAGDSDGCGAIVAAILVTVAVVVVLFAAVYAVVIAPTLMAELLVDGLVVGSLPKRRDRTWTGTAFRRTGWMALGLAVLLGLVGLGLEMAAPGSHTMGQAMGFGRAK